LTDALVGEHLVVRTWRLDGAAFDGNDDAPPTGAQLLQTISRADESAVLRARSDWAWRQQPLVVGGVPEP
jgi:hypothetical protein